MSDLYGKDAPLIDPEEMEKWILRDDEHLLVFNKPGWLVCHPSKAGPWSSLVGAVREKYQFKRIHMISRLDRETSGLVVFAKNRWMASRLQVSFSDRRTSKGYLAILVGELKEKVTVSGVLSPDPESPVIIQQRLGTSGKGKDSESHFEPIEYRSGYTLARVQPVTGRKHQIRVHAKHLGYPIVGDKIYGPDPNAYLEFIKDGLTKERLEELKMPRQALHAESLRIWGEEEDWEETFHAPLPEDMEQFWSGL